MFLVGIVTIVLEFNSLKIHFGHLHNLAAFVVAQLLAQLPEKIGQQHILQIVGGHLVDGLVVAEQPNGTDQTRCILKEMHAFLHIHLKPK